MTETSSSWTALQAALREAGSDETEFLDEAVRVVRGSLARRLSIEPQSQFTEAEVEGLRLGGLSLERRNASEPDIVARTSARESVMFIEAKTAGDVAQALGVSAARIRQRASERTLYAIRSGETWRFPAWQFDPNTGHEIPGLASVIPSFSPTLHPIAVFRFLDEPSPDLEIDDEPVSPLRWLATGGDPTPVAEIAAALQRRVVTKLPNPPASLAIPAEPITLDKGTLLWRVYRTRGGHPMSWNGFRSYGPVATARFDHHEPPPHDDPSRSIYYASASVAGAVVETFQDTRTIDRLDRAPWLVAFELEFDLVCLDLTRAWPTRAGASQAISSGRRDVARAWGRLIWREYPEVAGLWYPSAMSGGTHNIAAFERARSNLPAHPTLNVPLSHPGLEADLNRIAAAYGYDLRQRRVVKGIREVIAHDYDEIDIELLVDVVRTELPGLRDALAAALAED